MFFSVGPEAISQENTSRSKYPRWFSEGNVLSEGLDPNSLLGGRFRGIPGRTPYGKR